MSTALAGPAGRINVGMAVTFVSGRDLYKLQFIERYTKTKIRRGVLPTVGEVEEKRADALLDKVRATLESREGAAQSVWLSVCWKKVSIPPISAELSCNC